MKIAFGKKAILTFCSLSVFTLFVEQSYAVTEYRKQATGFVTDLKELKNSLNLPISDHIETLLLPVKKIETRIQKAAKDERIEPIQISVTTSDAGITAMAKELAYPGKENEVKALLLEKIKKLTAKQEKARVEIQQSDLALIDINAISRHLEKTHHNITISPEIFFTDKVARLEFFDELKGFLPRDQRKMIFDKIKRHESINVAADMLPEFARKMVKKYTIYRGPNCFHASLAFHGQFLTQSPFINVKEEKGYHQAMINYDELWRVINKDFYEIDAKRVPLKYGDMIVFFNFPRNPPSWVDFRWIRHASTYLVDGYTFSKGSKSPDTPYTIKTLPEEWKTWLGYTNNLGIKVFRRNTKALKSMPPIDLTDWIY